MTEPFIKAENAYRRERILATYPARRDRRTRRFSILGSSWVSHPAPRSLRTSLRSLRHSAPLA